MMEPINFKKTENEENPLSEGSGSRDKRTHVRIKVNLQFKYLMHEEMGDFQTRDELIKIEKNGRILDLGLGGIQIQINRPIPVGSFLMVYFFLPNITKGLAINSEVVWSNQDKAGLCFVMVKNEYFEVLKDFLDKNSKK